MQLTRFADLGLRVLMYLTREERLLPVTITEIADQFSVPRNHLIKVVNKLGKLGWVAATRGRNGGLRLALPAAELRLGKVVRALEGHGELIDCERPPCALSGHCRLKEALNVALEAFFEALDRYTLADICRNGTAETISQLHIQFLAARPAPVNTV